jgi:hypothetical protein
MAKKTPRGENVAWHGKASTTLAVGRLVANLLLCTGSYGFRHLPRKLATTLLVSVFAERVAHAKYPKT